MKVTVVCFGAMREFLPPEAQDNRAQLEVSGDTVGAVVDALGAPSSLVFAALVDGVRSDLGARVREGDEVTLMPPFTGG